MEETQAFDLPFNVFSESLAEPEDREAGSLEVTYSDERRERHPLFIGQNYVARRSAQSQKDEEKLDSWKRDNPNCAVYGIFIENASLSSPHAVVFIEGRGEFCFVKDRGSKNKTFLEGSTGAMLLNPGDGYSIASGAAVKFGNMSCTIRFASQPVRAPNAVAALEQPGQLTQDLTQAHSASETSEAGGALHGSDGQRQQQPHSEQAAAATLAQDALPASAQLRSPLPHLHAAKRPPAGAPSKPPPAPARAAPVLIPPPNAWPTAPLPLPIQLSKKPEQLQRPAQGPRTTEPSAAPSQPGQPGASEAQHASAWASFQHNAAVSMQKAHSIDAGGPFQTVHSMQKAHSIDTGGPFQAVQPGARLPSHRRSLDSLSPFASASAEAPSWGEDSHAASAALPVPAGAARGSSADREGSLKKPSSISSFREWGPGKMVPRRCSTERLPSLQDWMLPLCISSPGSAGHKQESISRACSQDLLCGEAMPRPEQLVQWAYNAGARPGAPIAPVRASHELLERMPDALPEALLSDTLPLADRNSASPKRSRGDDSPTAQATQQQRPKSPRLARSLLTSSFTLGAGSSCAFRCSRTGSPRAMRQEVSSGVGFAEFHRSIDMLWGSSGDGTRHVALPEATTAR